ncbi:hypothetical protein [Okeania sp. SIO2G5]|uniref:hypothetical protein n=1 Tax=Okeania sp. SIO2G5 TaxID=2607796 RepID=UPI0013B6A40B|nr:hypothetical protein [Okeania sp. SIO2G5]NEP96344.1 hypothetical protein [Okeania sp. SIO2F5]
MNLYQPTAMAGNVVMSDYRNLHLSYQSNFFSVEKHRDNLTCSVSIQPLVVSYFFGRLHKQQLIMNNYL